MRSVVSFSGSQTARSPPSVQNGSMPRGWISSLRISCSHLNIMSAVVNGSPSDQRSPSRSVSVRVRLLFDQAWLAARSASN